MTTPSTSPVGVLAGTHQEYLRWKEQNPGTRSVYCTSVEKILGCVFSSVVRTGTFWRRGDASSLLLTAQSRVREIPTTQPETQS